ncbi:MAG: signal peptidase II [Gemmatimonadota bacterium]|nr:signal peptidase II [Gemmatimonadota bacterium]
MESGRFERSNAALFWPLIAAVVVADVLTKWMAVRALVPMYTPRAVFGDWFRFTLVYNPGAAFGLHVGPYSRWVFLALTVVALVILGRLYLTTRTGDRLRTLALGLVCGGAIGNLIDRVRHDTGVVDFLDMGFGDWRWPTFNIADVAVSLGAFLLAWALWGEDDAEEAQLAPLGRPAPTRNGANGD